MGEGSRWYVCPSDALASMEGQECPGWEVRTEEGAGVTSCLVSCLFGLLLKWVGI